jgi:hypothetical protein
MPSLSHGTYEGNVIEYSWLRQAHPACAFFSVEQVNVIKDVGVGAVLPDMLQGMSSYVLEFPFLDSKMTSIYVWTSRNQHEIALASNPACYFHYPLLGFGGQLSDLSFDHYVLVFFLGKVKRPC